MEDFVDYKEKYIKYKSKYFQLKQDLDGGLFYKPLQSLARLGKQTYKTIAGKYDAELQEINAILNKTVYIDKGNILTVYDYDPQEDYYKQSNIANGGIQLIYSNLELLDPELFLSKKDTSTELTESPNSEVTKLPSVSKFLAAVKKVMSNTTSLASAEKDSVIQNVYNNRYYDLNRILQIHYMCKGASGLFYYTVEKCFINNHIPPSQKMSDRQKARLSSADQYGKQSQQYGQQSQQFGKQYRQKYASSNELYKLKYFKYKAKYLELEGGMLAALSSAASAVKKGAVSAAKGAVSVAKGAVSAASSAASSVKKGVVSSYSSVEDVVKILAKYPDIKAKFTNLITDKEFKEYLKDEIDKINNIKKLESIIDSKCKQNSKDTTYTNDKCFADPGTLGTGTATPATL